MIFGTILALTLSNTVSPLWFSCASISGLLEMKYHLLSKLTIFIQEIDNLEKQALSYLCLRLLLLITN